MSAEQLFRFLIEYQKDGGVTIPDAERIVEQVLQRRHHITKFTRHTLTLDDFHHYLFSVELNPPIKSQVCVHVSVCVEKILETVSEILELLLEVLSTSHMI